MSEESNEPANSESGKKLAVPDIIYEMVLAPKLGKDGFKKGGSWIEFFKAILATIPIVGAAPIAVDYFFNSKDINLFRKATRFVYEIEDIPKEEKLKFADELGKKAKDFPGNIIADMIDRLDNINKIPYFVNLTRAKMNGDISIEDFFRLSKMLEMIPYTDFYLLPAYEKPTYDKDGSTDILAASGALEIGSVVDEEGTKYVLSKSGRNLLRYGINLNIDTEHKHSALISSIDAGEYSDITKDLDELKDAVSWHDVDG